MANPRILRQQEWTEAELIDSGFRYYKSRKRIVMARELPAREAPLTIRTDWDTLVADVGYMICFEAGSTRQPNLYLYDHWPVHGDRFHEFYRRYTDAEWEPTPVQTHLLSLGCTPFVRRIGVWAKKLDDAILVQSIESPEPATVPAGAWLCIAATASAWGAPWSMEDEAFRVRYEFRP